jgi:hypothetical protein
LPTMAILRVYSSRAVPSIYSSTGTVVVKTTSARISFYQSSSAARNYSSTSTISVKGYISTTLGGYSTHGFIQSYGSIVSSIGGNG